MDLILQNPYIAGNPIKSEPGFYGREDVFREVQRLLNNSNENALVLYGQRRIGKTSILLQLQRRLQEDGAHTPIYFDLQYHTEKSLEEVLYELAKSLGEVANVSVSAKLESDKTGEYFRKEFLPQVVAARKNWVLLFDEFDVLDASKEEKKEAANSFLPYLNQWRDGFQEIKFIFVMGRKPEDLSLEFLSVLKSVRNYRVSVLSHDQTEDLIRISERNETLNWAEDAINKVWRWTQGNPYFTQLVCKTVWDGAYDQNPAQVPKVEARDVDIAIPGTIEQGAHAFEWIWQGLPPAEKIVMSAMSPNYDRPISERQLEKTLMESGVRIIIHELEDAPQKLCQWELIRKVKQGYRFFFPLLGRWIADNKPLTRVKNELDRINPRAERFYQLGVDFYEDDELEEARNFLIRSLSVNPNHLKAMVLLGQIYLEEQQPQKAIEILERAYKYHPGTIRNLLVQALLTDARQSDDAEYQFETYQRVQSIQPDNPDAQEGIKQYWQGVGDEARKKDDFDRALEAYQKGGLPEKVAEIQELAQKQKFDSLIAQAEQYQKQEDWQKLIDIYQELKSEFPEEGDWEKEIENAEQQEELSRLYLEALDKLKNGKNEDAQKLLAEVIYGSPNYKEVALYFLIASTGIAEIELKSLNRKITNAVAEISPKAEEPKALPTKNESYTLPARISNPSKHNAEYILIPGAKEKTVFESTGKPAPDYPLYFAKYPVTNARYRPFINYLAGSTDLPPREQFAERLLEYADTIEGFTKYLGKDWKAWSRKLRPLDKERFRADAQPAIVNWYAAVAYCQWLTALAEDGVAYRLPTEEEWEWAAGGGTRTYPWGDEPLDDGRANYGQKVGYTMPVDAYLAGATPDGLMDMVGNVREWMDNLYEEGESWRAMRGGSWRSQSAAVRCGARYSLRPDYGGYFFGFRVLRFQS